MKDQKNPLENLLNIVKDKTKSEEERSTATHIYGLLMFAEPIDGGKVRITKETAASLKKFIELLLLTEEVKDGKV